MRALADLSALAWPVFSHGVDPQAAGLALDEAGIGDGLPLVTPTVEGIGRMLEAALPESALPYVQGRMPPGMGDISLSAIAYLAVVAGCRPQELPLLQVAAGAAQEPRLNLLGVSTTTGSATVGLIVHGPIVDLLGMNAGSNCMGPGNRANACIGRAFQLILTHLGDARPGSTDMATMGQPGKYVFCLAERRHQALPGLHERRGAPPEGSAVTLFGVSGTREVLPTAECGPPDNLVVALADSICAAAKSSTRGRGGDAMEHLVLVPPELLDWLADVGCGWRQFQDLLVDRCGAPWLSDAESLQLVCTGGVGEKMTAIQPWGGGSLSVTRAIPDLR